MCHHSCRLARARGCATSLSTKCPCRVKLLVFVDNFAIRGEEAGARNKQARPTIGSSAIKKSDYT